MTVGERLKPCVRAKNDPAGVRQLPWGSSQAAVANMNTMKLTFPSSKLAALSDIFGVSIDYLIGKTAF